MVKIKSLKKCVSDNGIKILVYGPAGAGKTVLCATTGEPTLIISSEKGLLSIRDAPDYIKAAEIKNLDDLDGLLDFLKDDAENDIEDRAFRWVALDSISDIAEVVLAYEKANNKDPRAAYGNLQDHVLRLLREFRDLEYYNVVMTSKQERIDDDGKKIFGPLMPGAKLAQQIPYLFDEVFALRVEKDEDGAEYRVLQTSRDSRYEAKDRSGVLDMFERPNLKRIAKKIRSGMDTEGSAKIVEIDDDSADEQAVEEVKNEVDSNAPEREEKVEKEIAKRKMYYLVRGEDGEGDEVGIIEKGEELIDGVEYITRIQYNELISDSDE